MKRQQAEQSGPDLRGGASQPRAAGPNGRGWWSAGLAALALSGGLASGCPNDRRDSHCTPDGRSAAEDPECIYAGDGKVPAVIEPPCADVTGAAPALCPTFDQVFTVLTDPEKGNCTAGGCHGVKPGSFNIFLQANDQDCFYQALTETVGTNAGGKLYVRPDDPATPENEALSSYIVCNLRGERGGGFPMPVPAGMPLLSDVDLVADWVRCGAPGPTGDGVCSPEGDPLGGGGAGGASGTGGGGGGGGT